MNTLEAWQYLVAVAAPFLIAVLNRPWFTATRKRIVMVVASVVIALITMLIDGSLLPLNPERAFPVLVLFVGAVQVAYTMLTSIPVTRSALNKTEVATSPGSTVDAVQQKQAASQEQVVTYATDVSGSPNPVG